MRNRFDEQLEELNRMLIEMGAQCASAIGDAAKSLIDGDYTLAGKIAHGDSEINRMERNIETLCLKLLLQQQPVARDLRQISAALKMITDMERIGDQAADIAEIIESLNGRTILSCAYIDVMAQSIIKMVTESLEAYVARDIEMAERVVEYDDVVDDLFDKIKNTLISMISTRPNDGEYALDLLMIAKYFERIGDHATNIAEWVVFSVTGVHKADEEL